VAGYTITITSNDDESGAQTTIRVDTASGDARITELTVRAAEGGAIFPQQLPALNLDRLIAALVPSGPTAITDTPGPDRQASNGHSPTGQASSGQASSEHASSEQASTRSDLSEAEVAGESPETPEPAPSARVGRPARGKKTSRTAPAKTTPARSRQARAEKTAATAQANGRRAYRRMPETAEVLAAYREVGGTTALARHFGVPRHTATGWLRRLRTQGLLDS
jgi:hypothetical protein